MSRPTARLWPNVYDDCPGLHAPGPWLRLVVHPDLDDMRRLAKRAHPGEDHSQAAGIFQPSATRYRHDGEAWRRSGNGYLGTMRLWADRVTTEVVAHECVHAAAHLYRVLHDRAVDIGDDCGPDEEHFAYHLGSMVAQVSSALHDMGVWA